MTTLLENPAPIYAVGAVLATLCGLVFLTRRNLLSLLIFAGVVGATLLLLLVERLVVTDAEEVEVAVAQIMDAIAANDLPGVLALLDPNARSVRSDADAMMPQVNVTDTSVTSLRVEVDSGSEPLTAVAHFRGKVDGVHKRTGHRVLYFDMVQLDWVKRDGRWLVESYQANWRGEPINAVDSLRSNRATPLR